MVKDYVELNVYAFVRRRFVESHSEAVFVLYRQEDRQALY